MRSFFARSLGHRGKAVMPGVNPPASGEEAADAEADAVLAPGAEVAQSLTAEELASTFALRPGSLDAVPARLAAYLMIEPFLRGRSVLDLGGGGAASLGLLRRSCTSVTVADLSVLDPGGAPFDEGGFDVVLCLTNLTAAGEPARPRRLLHRLASLVHPGGMLVVRVESHDGPLRPRARPGLSRSSLQILLSSHFRFVDVVDQVPLLGFVFGGDATPRLAVSEALMPRVAPPSHHLAFATSADPRPYELDEQLLVPCARPIAEVAAKVAASAPAANVAVASQGAAMADERQREIERLRERLMEAEDERDRLRATTANLRRETDRLLGRLSDQAATLEILSLAGAAFTPSA